MDSLPESHGPPPIMPAEQELSRMLLVEPASPAAVLVVSLATRAVVHANLVAQRLAPGVQLPVTIDRWSDAARLRDVHGEALSDSRHPLSRLIEGREVSGQPVTVPRDSAPGAGRASLWVVGSPLTGQHLDEHALVVFLPVQSSPADQHGAVPASAQDALGTRLRERALLATGITFTVADARADDQPLLWVNPAFTQVTGYGPDEVVGRNCRFLQGPGTDPQARHDIREALQAGRPCTTTILNYRKDGTAFWNLLAINPIHDDTGTLTHFVGIQHDVTAKIESDRQRDAALLAEVAAHQRLALMAEGTSRLSDTLDVEDTLQRLLDLVVPSLADGALISTDLPAAHTGAPTATHVAAADDALVELANHLEGRDLPLTLADATASEPWRRDVAPDWFGDGTADALPISPAMPAEWRDWLGSLMCVPLPGRRQQFGTLLLVRGPKQASFTEPDLTLAEDLGRRAGLALETARLYQAEHQISETLQRSLLPALPDISGVRLIGHYRAAHDAAEVGGDFYDVMQLPDGTITVAIGDVMGHDIQAAAAMGQLRGMLRALAWETGREPGQLLDRLDNVMTGIGDIPLTTIAYAALRPPHAPDTPWTITYASAGHPPFLLRAPDGHVSALQQAQGIILGVQPRPHGQAVAVAAPGSTLLGYTDGLIERRGHDAHDGITRVSDILAASGGEPDRLCQHLLGDHASDEDDTAVLAIALDLPVYPDPEDRPSGASGRRRLFRRRHRP